MKKSAGIKVTRLLPLLLGGGVLAVLLPYAGRALWFDEALTVLQFAVLPSAGAVYHAYVIPNNQIIHTILVRFFLENVPGGMDLVHWLRLLPVLTALGTVLILFCRFRKICGVWPLAAVLTAWILSPPFVTVTPSISPFNIRLSISCSTAISQSNLSIIFLSSIPFSAP